MKAVQLLAPGLDGAKIVDLDDPTASKDEILIRMKAVSFNARDLGVAGGKIPVKLPLVPLSDGVGVVEAVGPGQTRIKVGDRVCPIFSPRWIAGPPSDDTGSPALGGDTDGVLDESRDALGFPTVDEGLNAVELVFLNGDSDLLGCHIRHHTYLL